MPTNAPRPRPAARHARKCPCSSQRLDPVALCRPILRAEFLWGDDDNTAHSIRQGEGGEQGDPVMPAVCALGQHAALQEVAAALQEGEHVYAFLGAIHVTCSPERVRNIFDLFADALFRHCGISVNLGKTSGERACWRLLLSALWLRFDFPLADLCGVDGNSPEASDVFVDARFADGSVVSRLPAR